MHREDQTGQNVFLAIKSEPPRQGEVWGPGGRKLFPLQDSAEPFPVVDG